MPDKKKKPAWQSVEQQLTAANDVRGTALEKLIKGNPDFGPRQPEEAHYYWREQCLL